MTFYGRNGLRTERMKRITLYLNLATILILLPWSPAHAATIDFETFLDSTALTNQIAGLTFTRATVLSAGISLNEFEFPPRSGRNVAFDDGGPMRIAFSTPMESVGGFFTYSTRLTLTAFDALNNPLGSIMSAFSSNLALSGVPGSAPNEFRGLAFAAGIKSVLISGDPAGGSFTLDDLSFEPAIEEVPEPTTLLLFATGLGAALMRVIQRARSARKCL